MKKNSFLKTLIFIFVLTFVFVAYGCAKTESDEIFRFEVNSLELTVGQELEIGMIKGSVDEDEKVRYLAEYEVFETNEETGEKESKWVNADKYLAIKASSKDEKGVIGGVNENVKLTALKEGVIRFTAEVVGSEEVNDIIFVTISLEKLTLLDINVEKTRYVVGEKGKATVKVWPKDIQNDVEWSSSNESVLTIDKNGEFTVHKSGSANIIAVSKYDSKLVALQTIQVTTK